MNLSIPLIVLTLLIKSLFGARILAVVLTPSHSHQSAFTILWKELSKRGHQVLLLTTNPIQDKSLTNLTEVDLSIGHYLKNNKYNMAQQVQNKQGDLFSQLSITVNISSKINEELLLQPEVQKIIRNESEMFDLIMLEYTFPSVYAFPHRFKAPCIALLSVPLQGLAHAYIGNPTHPAVDWEYPLPFVGKFSFTERLINTVYRFTIPFLFSSLISMEEAVIERVFGPNYPSIFKLTKDIDMFFSYTNPIFHNIRPSVPAHISISGLHIKEPRPLPNELKEWMDNSKNGIIYFSLGTNYKSKDLTDGTKEILISVFSELPYDILWKFEAEDLEGKPPNVRISKWLPQQDILRHSSIKLFITQAGLQSFEEAFYSHIPMLAMPIASDQKFNAKNIAYKGFGLHLDIKTLDKTTFKNSIQEIIENPMYKNKIKEMATLALDQPISNLDNAIWWTEYVIRHKGAKHLKGPAINIPWYQYWLIDVIGFFIVVFLLISWLLIKVLKSVKYLIVGKQKKE